MRASTWTDLSVAEVITLVVGRAVGVDEGGNEYAVVEAGRNESIVVR